MDDMNSKIDEYVNKLDDTITNTKEKISKEYEEIKIIELQGYLQALLDQRYIFCKVFPE
jgi:restriction endonuclease S subunit